MARLKGVLGQVKRKTVAGGRNSLMEARAIFLATVGVPERVAQDAGEGEHIGCCTTKEARRECLLRFLSSGQSCSRLRRIKANLPRRLVLFRNTTYLVGIIYHEGSRRNKLPCGAVPLCRYEVPYADESTLAPTFLLRTRRTNDCIPQRSSSQ